MRSTLSFLLSFVMLTFTATTPNLARAHGATELFADEFAEVAQAEFHVRPLPPNENTSYVIFKDGRRVYLDSSLRRAVESMARGMVNAQVPQQLHHDPSWREWRDHAVNRVVSNVKHLFSRRFVLEWAASGVQAYYRFGVLAAGLIILAEGIEHGPGAVLTGGLPLCSAVYASCIYLSRESQEILTVADPRYLKPLSYPQRISQWWTMRRKRREVKRAMKHVYRASDNVDLNRLARNRSFRDFEEGAAKIYGGMLGPGFFRGVLADVVAEDHDHDHADTALGGRIKVPIIDDFTTKYRHATDRIMKTEEYIKFIELILDWATMAAADLTRTHDKDGTYVPLKVTYGKAPGFLGLNRDLARMRRSLDVFSIGLRMRALQSTPRSYATYLADVQFAQSIGEFLEVFVERLHEVDAGVAQPVTRDSPLWTIPERAKTRVREWMATPGFCDDVLTKGLLPGPG